MTEAQLHTYVALGVIGVALPTFAYLLLRTAPYGRHGRPGWGPTLPPRIGWILMESPAVLVWLGVYLTGDHRFEATPLALLGLWQLHYVHRTFIFPFRMRGAGKPMPWLIALSGVFFNCVNAWINARWVSQLGAYPVEWLTSRPFLAGMAVFLLGMAINLHADTVLLNLRAPGETGYKIPRGGLYTWVTCPNYLGETLEWTGWTLATFSLAGLSFLIFTTANLLPRALANHRWYREKFPDYPAQRRAFLPFLL